MRERRGRLPDEERRCLSARIGDGLSGFLAPVSGMAVSAFHGMDDEVDTIPWLARLHERGARIALPRVVRAGEPLAFLRWRPGDTLERSRFGVLEPKADSEPLDPDTVIAPLLAFDRQGGRLGYGGGFYDRTLERLRRSGHARRVVGVAFAFQEVPAVPMEATDQRLDAVVTETGPVLMNKPVG